MVMLTYPPWEDWLEALVSGVQTLIGKSVQEHFRQAGLA